MNRFLSLLVLVLAFSAIQCAQAATGKARPNVLVVLCDDLRWDCLGCAGHPYLRTPNIDQLAAEGVRFRNAFCTTSLCSPSRASILSGLYAHKHRVMNNFTEFPLDLPNFPRALQAAGYETAYIGKWHMGEDNDEKRPGFDYWISHRGQGKYYGTEFNVNGQRKVLPGYYTHVVTQFAVDWLKRPHSRPWLLMVGEKAPHSFYIPEPKYSNTFDQVEIEYPDTAFKLEDKPAWIRQRLYTWHGIYGPLFEWRKNFPDDRPAAVKDFAAMIRAYWSVILSVDDSIGALTLTLEAQDQLDNTIIVFLGDNGQINGEHGMVDKRTMHEPSIRIPLVVRYPGLTAPEHPRVIDQMVLTEDIAPSVLDLCGVTPPKDAQGKSFKTLVQQGDPTWRRSFLYEYNYEKQFPYTPNVRGVRTDGWAYMHYPPGNGEPDRHLAELYDLNQDPEERHNLIGNPRYAPKLAELQRELASLLKTTGATPDSMPLDEGIKTELPDQKIR
ncbi:MAG: sulfatase [Candidatus Omnitrophica bacterium]|nr:sulfatase [Candidatus Omnitrophota bacterium]